MENYGVFDNDFILMERDEIGGIPCLIIRQRKKEGPFPTVLYYHGWGSNKENQIFKGSVIASCGYQVVIPDSIYHGERDPITHNAGGIIEKYFWEVVINSVEESKILIDNIVENYKTDRSRIGVMGHSMGGFIASGIFTANAIIKCLVNYNGACAWIKADELFRKTHNQPPTTEDDVLRLSKFDLTINISRLKLRPILLVHGDSDTSVPIESQEIFYKDVAPLYKENPEQLRFSKYQKLDHYITLGMLEEGILWLKKYL